MTTRCNYEFMNYESASETDLWTIHWNESVHKSHLNYTGHEERRERQTWKNKDRCDSQDDSYRICTVSITASGHLRGERKKKEEGKRQGREGKKCKLDLNQQTKEIFWFICLLIEKNISTCSLCVSVTVHYTWHITIQRCKSV